MVWEVSSYDSMTWGHRRFRDGSAEPKARLTRRQCRWRWGNLETSIPGPQRRRDLSLDVELIQKVHASIPRGFQGGAERPQKANMENVEVRSSWTSKLGSRSLVPKLSFKNMEIVEKRS